MAEERDSGMPQPARGSVLRTLGVIVACAVAVMVLLGVLASQFPSPRAASAAGATSSAAPVTSDTLVAEIQADAERLRKAQIGRAVAVERLDRPGLKVLLDRLIAQEDDPKLTRGSDDTLHLMGVLRPDEDLETISRAGLDSGIAGLYDPKTDKLYVVDGKAVQATQSTMLHEIVHAIQDERYDLDGTIFTSRPTDQDGQTAAQSVAEGDATEVQTRFLAEAGLGGLLDELGGSIGLITEAPGSNVRTPPFMTRAAQFPYLTGSEFVAAVRKDGGEAAVDRAFRNPPKSTLAVMIPSLWLSGNDTPRPVDVPRPASGARRTFATTFGAADLWAYLGDRRMAETWRGGRVVIDRVGDRATMTMVIASVRPQDLAASLRKELPPSARVTVAGAIVTATNAATLT